MDKKSFDNFSLTLDKDPASAFLKKKVSALCVSKDTESPEKEESFVMAEKRLVNC